MSSDDMFLEDGELESDTDETTRCKNVASSTAETDDVHENVDRTADDCTRKADKVRSARQGRRRRRSKSKERTSSREAKRQSNIDPVEIAEMDEFEMLCIRGASPVRGAPFNSVEGSFQHLYENQQSATYYEYERDYRYDSDGDNYSRRRSPPGSRRRRDRGRRRRQSRRQSVERRDRRRRSRSRDEIDEMDERKLEICKFYLLDCCVKRSICKYMHAEFPCKYYYLGLECQNEKPCKFSHGKALTEEMTQALARHVAAAPKAILGNFRRYSRDKALCMIQAKNRQLNGENESVSRNKPSPGRNQCKTDKSPQSSTYAKPVDSPKKSTQDISAIFSAQQIEKMMALGISNLQQVKQMSLAQLADIGLSLSQIGEIQKTTEQHDEEKIIIEPPPSACRNNENDAGDDDEMNASRSDMDMRQQLPLLPAVSGNNKTDSTESLSTTAECVENDKRYESDILMSTDDTKQGKEEEQQQNQTTETNSSLVDDDPQLVIDETVENDDGNESDKEYICELKEAASTSNNEPIPEEESYFNDISDEEMNDKDSSSMSEDALFDSISFDDEPFESSELNLERSENDAKNTSDEKTSVVLSDYDMRLPFADVIANYVPAMEIDASLKSYLGTPYLLNEILIPDKKEPPIRLESIPENTIDPRLKKYVVTKKKKTDENSFNFLLDLNATPSLVNPYKSQTQTSEPSVDPRKRKGKSHESTQKSIQQNFNYVLNTFLQKSKWFQNLNSTNKIEVNKHLADLTSELNRFSQNCSRDVQFHTSNLPNSLKIQEILYEIGLEVNTDGIILERKAKPTEVVEEKPPKATDGPQVEIPSLLKMNLNPNPPPTLQNPSLNFQQVNQVVPNILPLPNVQPPRFSFPKPGLLGIAPGIEGPPAFLHGQDNPAMTFSNRLNPVIWSDRAANFPLPRNVPNIHPILDQLSRRQFGMQMNNNNNNKRWNRKPAMKKPRRI